MPEQAEATTTVSDAERHRGWRMLIGAAGVVSFVGGGLHPESQDGLSFRDSLVAMMEGSTWVPGHALLAVGSALFLAGLLIVRRTGAWSASGHALRFAIGATVFNTLELVFHTVAVVDKDALAGGDWPPIATLHLGLAVVAYPLFGAAIVWLAWRLLKSWNLFLRVFSVLGIVGGIANALAAPLTILLRNPEYAFLFPIGGIGISLWLTVVGLVGPRQELLSSSKAERHVSVNG